MKRLKLSRRYFRTGKPIKPWSQPTQERYKVWSEFDDYQRKNYFSIPVKCLCGNNNEYCISIVDKEGWEYPLMICESCGLIKAKEYWNEKGVNDYYKNWYRKLYDEDQNPKLFYENQKYRSKKIYDFVYEHTKKFMRPYTVFDIGGAVGGVLHEFKKEANCFLFDYNEPFLKFAKKMGLVSVKGGIDKLDKVVEKPDLVILSHVLEHFTNVEEQLKELKKHLKIGTLVYVELPGLDSLKEGRRRYDFLGDIQKAHVFYFSLDVLKNLMSRNNFRCIKSDTEIKSLYEYSEDQGQLVNYHDSVVSFIRSAELKRKLGYNILKSFIRNFFPRSLVIWCKEKILHISD